MACFPLSAADVDVPAFSDLREACRRLRFLPVFRHELLLQVALAPPAHSGVLAAIRQLTHQEVRAFGISREDFDQALDLLDPVLVAEPAVGSGPESPPRCPESWECHRRGGREVAADLVRFAHASRASDLLLDEQEGWLDVALKVDGRKEMLPPVAKAAAPALLRAFKQMAGISTQSSPAPRSGSASFPVGAGRQADVRLEIIPTVHGESLVARVQDRARQLDRMRQLPFDDPGQRARVEACLAQRQGLILVTGPPAMGRPPPFMPASAAWIARC